MLQRKQTEPLLSTYLHSKGGRLGLPIGGNFELTARCNFNCPMCYVHQCSVREDQELTAQQWIEIARKAKEKGMMFALLTGGEPFIRRDFFEIFDAMKNMGIMVSINSNGSMLDGEIRRRLIENPPFRMNISLYGSSGETYRNMCGQDAFERVVENIRALKDAGVDVRLNLSITPYNYQDLEKICNIARDLDVQVKASAYMYPPVRIHGDVEFGHRLTPEEAAASTVEWDLLRFGEEEFARRARGMKDLCAISPRECGAVPEEGVGCRAGSSSFWLTWDGRMLPCGMMPGPASNVLEVGFDAAWDAIRAGTRKIRMPKECTACPKRQVCPACAAVCVTETGAFDRVPTYVCRQTEETIRLTWERYQQKRGKYED